MMHQEKRVVVTGIGPLTAIGIGNDQVWDAVKAGKTNVVLLPQAMDDEYWDSFHVAKVNNFDIHQFGLEPHLLEVILKNHPLEDLGLLYLMATAKLALDDSQLKYDKEANHIGLLLTHENPGIDYFVKQALKLTLDIAEGKRPDLVAQKRKDLVEQLYSQFDKIVYNLNTFMPLYYTSKALSLHGYSLFINNACASGLYALEAANCQIKSGLSEVVVVAGADYPVSMTKHLWFKQLGLYAKDGIMRPFDKNRTGIVFGDGGSAIVLEEMEHALRRGAFIYAEYLGGGFAQDAWKVTVPNVLNNFYTKAFEEAMMRSQIRPEEIDFVNPHGAATRISDKYEAKTITDIFGSSKKKPLISAFKPYVGHNLGGSALVELTILLKALCENFVPPTLNYETADPELKIEVVTEPISMTLRTVAKMATGFAGYNGVAIFQKITE